MIPIFSFQFLIFISMKQKNIDLKQQWQEGLVVLSDDKDYQNDQIALAEEHFE